MTLNEISLPEGISSSPEHATNTDPQKAKISRRRRVEIQRLKSSCQETKNGVVTPSNEDNYYSQGSTCSGVHGAVSVMGRRREMEDAITVEKDLVSRKYDYFGVYDGHGGSQVAEACRDRMHSILLEEMERCETRMKINGCDEDKENVDWEKVMGKCFARMDEEVGRGGGRADNVEEMTVGSTVVVAVVGREEVVVANCGDSRAVICRNGVAVPLSVDHKVIL